MWSELQSLSKDMEDMDMDFLTKRSQCVRYMVRFLTFSSLLRVLHRVVVSLHCYTFCTLTSVNNRCILKFADDTTIVGLLEGGETAHGQIVDDFVSWCKNSFLHKNVSKTRDMVIDFRKSPSKPRLLVSKQLPPRR